MLIQREDTTFYLKESMVDLKELEDVLLSNPMIAEANLFKTPQGILNVKLEERNPIIRIVNNDKEFYNTICDFQYKIKSKTFSI